MPIHTARSGSVLHVCWSYPVTSMGLGVWQFGDLSISVTRGALTAGETTIAFPYASVNVNGWGFRSVERHFATP